MKKKNEIKVIPGNRRTLEKEVLRVLIDPLATNEDIDRATQKLKPHGQLKSIEKNIQNRSVHKSFFEKIDHY